MTNKQGWVVVVDLIQTLIFGLAMSTLAVILITLYLPAIKDIFKTDPLSLVQFQMEVVKIDGVLFILSGYKIWKMTNFILFALKIREMALKDGLKGIGEEGEKK